MIPKNGDRLQDFTLPMATVDGVKEFRLSEALPKGPIVIGFYPLAFTGVCTREVCEMRDSYKELSQRGAQVFGFSTDTPHTNVAFAKSHNLPYPLLSDPNHTVVERIWETQTVAGVERRAKRGLLLLDKGGVVRFVWKTDNPSEWPGLSDLQKCLSQI